MGFEPGRSNLENLNKDTQQIGIGIAGALIEIPDVLRLRRDEEEGCMLATTSSGHCTVHTPPLHGRH